MLKRYYLTGKAAIKLRSHGNVSSPTDRSKTDKTCRNWWIQIVTNYGVSVRVTSEFLSNKKKKKKGINIPYKTML